jgi:hypothetical protein
MLFPAEAPPSTPLTFVPGGGAALPSKPTAAPLDTAIVSPSLFCSMDNPSGGADGIGRWALEAFRLEVAETGFGFGVASSVGAVRGRAEAAVKPGTGGRDMLRNF